MAISDGTILLSIICVTGISLAEDAIASLFLCQEDLAVDITVRVVIRCAYVL